jgi:hypothetical protein
MNWEHVFPVAPLPLLLRPGTTLLSHLWAQYQFIVFLVMAALFLAVILLSREGASLR